MNSSTAFKPPGPARPPARTLRHTADAAVLQGTCRLRRRQRAESEAGHVGPAAFRIRHGIPELRLQLVLGDDVDPRIADHDDLPPLMSRTASGPNMSA